MPKTSTMLCLGAALVIAGCTDRPTTSPNRIPGELPVNFCCGGPSSPWTATKLTLPTGTWDESGARGVNDSGVVVGYVRVAPLKYRPVRWNAAGAPSFLVVTTQNHWALATAVNNSGDVVGQMQWISGNLSQPIQPVRWSNGFMQTLPNLGWDGWALDINASRVAVGFSRATYGGPQHAVKWSSSGAITDLHPVGATWSGAQGINDFGDIVGVAMFNGVVHGWKWQPDNSTIDLGPVLNATVGEIANSREAIGTATFQGVTQAVMWTPNGTPTTINAGSGSIGVTIGDSRRAVGFTNARAWTTRFDPSPTVLPLPSGAATTFGRDVNRCGMIVGHAAGGTLTMQTAAKWTKSTCDP